MCKSVKTYRDAKFLAKEVRYTTKRSLQPFSFLRVGERYIEWILNTIYENKHQWWEKKSPDFA